LAQEHLQKIARRGEARHGRWACRSWYLTDPHSKYGEAAQRALKKAFERDPVLIREGGSIPIVSDFRNILGAETLLLGLALPDCRAHSPNENFPLENLDAGIRINKAVLKEIDA
jgi:acetylornithine deacetylase/succinyl-diaminopimelate desuccinylase-like protein